jgi:hypothetical protein
MEPRPRYTAVVKKRVTSRQPVLQTSGKPVLVAQDGQELPKDPDGKYIGTGEPKVEIFSTDSVDDPVTDEAGNPLEAGTPEALLRMVRESYDEDTEVLEVWVQETKTVRTLTGAELKQVR